MRSFIRSSSMVAVMTGCFIASSGALAADARDAIFQAYQNLMASKFSADITTVSGDTTMKSHSDYETVERIHIKNDKMEMIVLPEGTWMRTGKNWTQPPIDMSGMVRQFIPKSVDDLRAATKSAKDDGAATWNGQPVHTYSYDINTTMMGIHVASTNKIFVNASGQIVHVESDGEAMGRKSHTTQDIHYDTSIRVVAPQ